MNAHKDTQHPAGQVITQDKGQSTLSDYIRSINRAQAFDDTAAEKKLTFNEWFALAVHSGSCNKEDKDLTQAVWNDALKHGKISP